MTTYYVGPDGSDSNGGTSRSDAFATLSPLDTDNSNLLSDGDVVRIMDGGVIGITSDTAFFNTDNLTFEADPDAASRPVLDGSNWSGDATTENGCFYVGQCEFPTITGLEIRNMPSHPAEFDKTGQNASYPFSTVAEMEAGGLVEDCIVHHNGAPLFWGEGKGGIARNVESYMNYDPVNGGGNADGIQFTAGGNTDNITHRGGAVIGCSLHHNSDDGLDLYRAEGILIKNSWAYANGYDLNGNRLGDTSPGKGFKLGGGDENFNSGGSLIYGCAAWSNGAAGIGFNGSNKANDVWNCVAFDNSRIRDYEDDIEVYTVSGPSGNNTEESTFYNVLIKDEVYISSGSNLQSGNVVGCNFNSSGSVTNAWSNYNWQSLAVDSTTKTPSSPSSFLRPLSDALAVDNGVQTPTSTAGDDWHNMAQTLPYAGDSPDQGSYEFGSTSLGYQGGTSGGDGSGSDGGTSDTDTLEFTSSTYGAIHFRVDESADLVSVSGLDQLEYGGIDSDGSGFDAAIGVNDDVTVTAEISPGSIVADASRGDSVSVSIEGNAYTFEESMNTPDWPPDSWFTQQQDLLDGGSQTAPTAEAGQSQTVIEGEVVVLDGTGSTDPDDDPLTYSWTQLDGPDATLSDADKAVATFVAPVAFGRETASFELTVSDGTETATDTVSVTIRAPFSTSSGYGNIGYGSTGYGVSTSNSSPTADAGSDITVDAGESVTLDASASSDPDGQTLSYSWTQTSGKTVTLANADTVTPEFTAPTNTTNNLVFEVTVSDGEITDTDSVAVTVNDPPIADAGDNFSAVIGTTAELDASASSDPDFDPLSYQWQQTQGIGVSLSDISTKTPEFTVPDSDQNLVFEVTVSDGRLTDTDSVAVTPQEQETTAPGYISESVATGSIDYVINATATMEIDEDDG